jgi:hypothetical protein
VRFDKYYPHSEEIVRRTMTCLGRARDSVEHRDRHTAARGARATRRRGNESFDRSAKSCCSGRRTEVRPACVSSRDRRTSFVCEARKKAVLKARPFISRPLSFCRSICNCESSKIHQSSTTIFENAATPSIKSNKNLHKSIFFNSLRHSIREPSVLPVNH